MTRFPARLAVVVALALIGAVAPPRAWAGALAPEPKAGEPAPASVPEVKPDEQPEITNVHPPAPYADQAVEITIYGSGFSEDQANVQVSMAGVAAASVDVQSPRRIKAIFPALGKTGVASVTVRNPSGREATMERAVYFRPPEGLSWTALRFRLRYDWRGFKEWFKLGGPLMYVFVVVSFFGLAWAVHCFLVLRRSQILPQRFMEALSSQLSQGDLRGATTTCERSGCALGRVILSGLRKTAELEGSPGKIREAIGAAGSRESAHLHQKISYLANVGTISPMLGLLGTVFGMIMAFNIISLGEVRPYLLAAAIAQAMVTTAAGLVIGIPALAIYFYLRGRLLRLVTHMEVVADEVTETIIEKAEEA